MKMIDLSHEICPEMPVYPGTDPPVFKLAKTLENDGYLEKTVTMFSHTGTHIDAPSHIFENAPSLDKFPAGHFAGRGLVLDVTETKHRTIAIENLTDFEAEITAADYLLFHTGWSSYWGYEDYFKEYPALSEDTANWLAENFSLKGIGVDTISVDPEHSRKFPVHRALLGRGILVVENLANLDLLLEASFLFFCFPLKISGADGSPVRAAAGVPE